MKSMLLLLTFLLSACSADIGRGIAESDCSKIRNNADREQCYKDADRTFRDY
ncbi:hypothetical protein [Enterovibrio calviensis]|uniref:hypothetical protein n=1 Tax=Enterovibrio calviensis TaxID=91359 RepID=UPI000B05C698|nr:hypothetical protein [Enterovibrio calviensis]